MKRVRRFLRKVWASRILWFVPAFALLALVSAIESAWGLLLLIPAILCAEMAR